MYKVINNLQDDQAKAENEELDHAIALSLAEDDKRSNGAKRFDGSYKPEHEFFQLNYKLLNHNYLESLRV